MSLFAIVLLIVFVLVIVPILFWILLGLFRSARKAGQHSRKAD